MNRKKYLAIPILAVLTVALGIGVGAVTSGNAGQNNNDQATVSEGPTYRSMVSVYKNGKLIDKSPNYFTSTGKDWLIGQAGGINTYGATVNSIDNITYGIIPSTTASSLSTVHDSYSSLAWSSIATGNMTASHQFTAGSTLTVNGTSLRVSGDGNTVFSTNDFNKVTLQPNDEINITWTVWVS